MKELGGYLQLEQFAGTPYHYNLIELNSGRNALAYLIRARGIRSLLIPEFLCDSVSNVCKREGISVKTYGITKEFLPREPFRLGQDEWLYLVNFYGQLSNDQVLEYHQRYGRLILDNVHAFFQRPVPGVDTLYSCRKFFGVPDGAYLSTDCRLPNPLGADSSKERFKHLLGRFEGAAADYYSDFQANDSVFEELPVLTMSPLTKNLLCAVDYDKAKQARNQNFAVLHQRLGTKNPLLLRHPDGPYAYPFYCQNGMALKRALAQKKIYVATLWPNVLEASGALEQDYAQNILPLPCDQRYQKEDMLHLAEIIEQWLLQAEEAKG